MTRDPLVERLCGTLSRVQELAGADFSGIGVIVCDQPDRLPIFPISSFGDYQGSADLVSELVAISSQRSEHHDGFQVVSSNWKLTRIAQYFSPPIVSNAEVDRTKRFGGRYLAALFGSALPIVKLSGVASHAFGVAVFECGREVLHERRA
jgi:hypothetical protein